jgi:hypothetical protein
MKNFIVFVAGVIVGAIISNLVHDYRETQKDLEKRRAIAAENWALLGNPAAYVPSGDPNREAHEILAQEKAKEMARCKALEMDEYMPKERTR